MQCRSRSELVIDIVFFEFFISLSAKLENTLLYAPLLASGFIDQLGAQMLLIAP